MQLLSLRTFVRTCLLVTLAISALAMPPVSHAMLMGVEANGELVNPERTPAQQAASLNRIQAQGARLIRVNVSWKQIAANCGNQSLTAQRLDTNRCYNWAVYDSLVSLAQDRGIQLLFSVTREPFWVNHSSSAAYVGASSAQWARTVKYYPAFITAIAHRYGERSTIGTVRLWTIWSEPNSSDFWQPLATPGQRALAPARYAILYGAAARALKAAEPTATVAPGPT
ncbi:MAG: hypothetical protein JWN41_1534, partial [Thermoleophilia bacterium]|nr:hypothetical protein [Thermoleophilia bacterium]